MPVEIIDQSILLKLALVIGGILGGAVGAKKLPLTRTSSPQVQISDETGGNKHISEEALGKLTGLQDKLEEDYTPTDHQADKCRANHAELTTQFIKEVGKSEKRILDAIKENGK